MSTLALPVHAPFQTALNRAVSTGVSVVGLLPDWSFGYQPGGDQTVTTTDVGDVRKHALVGLSEAYRDAVRIGSLVDASTLAYAKQFLAALPTAMPLPDIVVEEDGDIAFDWDLAARCVLSVSIARDGTLTYGGLFGHSRQHGVETFAGAMPSSISNAIERLMAGG